MNYQATLARGLQHFSESPRGVFFDLFLNLLGFDSSLFGGGGFLFGLESLNFADGVHELLLAGVEGMAVVAKFNVDLLFCGSDGEHVTASTDYLSLRVVLRVDAGFHNDHYTQNDSRSQEAKSQFPKTKAQFFN